MSNNAQAKAERDASNWPPETEMLAPQNWQVNENAKLLAIMAYPPLLQEIGLFKQLHKNAVAVQLTDNIDEICEARDWVGGCFETISPKHFGKVCIVEIEDELQVKLVKEGSKADVVCLHSPYQSEPNNKIKDVKLTKVARIVRVWK